VRVLHPPYGHVRRRILLRVFSPLAGSFHVAFHFADPPPLRHVFFPFFCYASACFHCPLRGVWGTHVFLESLTATPRLFSFSTGFLSSRAKKRVFSATPFALLFFFFGKPRLIPSELSLRGPLPPLFSHRTFLPGDRDRCHLPPPPD